MTTYCFFYDKAGYRPCGDRSVITIDGRLSSQNVHNVAYHECKARGFTEYRVVRAQNLRDIGEEYEHLDSINR